MAEKILWIIFFAGLIGIVFLIARWFIRMQADINRMPDHPLSTTDEVLNSKVPKEGGHVLVSFGGKIIQLTPEEFVVFNSWDRKRKRIFVRDFAKIKDKDKKK